jgi:hypothetical protein
LRFFQEYPSDSYVGKGEDETRVLIRHLVLLILVRLSKSPTLNNNASALHALKTHESTAQSISPYSLDLKNMGVGVLKFVDGMPHQSLLKAAISEGLKDGVGCVADVLEREWSKNPVCYDAGKEVEEALRV